MAAPNLALAFGLPPEAAIEYFRSKGVRISRRASDMAAAAYARSFTVAGVLKGDVLQDISDALDGALAKGKTYQQFLKELRPALKAKGWWGVVHDPQTGEVQPGRAMNPHRLRTVYQTNLQAAYQAGRYKSMLENADRRPYWEYVAVMDSRTRPRHRSLNGRIFRYDDPAWGYIYAPNGYNCRCRIRAKTAEQFAAEGGVLSKGEGRIETITVDQGKRGKASVTGYRDPGTKEFFAPDVGFDSNPGQSAFGIDIALARNVRALKSRDLRSQVWQGLNNSPLRQAEFNRWADNMLAAAGKAGHGAQVVGFVDEAIAKFAAEHAPDVEPIRVVAMNEKRLAHAFTDKHVEGGIAITREQLAALPGIVAAPDAVYFDKAHGNLAYVRKLADGGVIYAALTPGENIKRVGKLDALVNVYRLPPGAEGAGRLENAGRFVRMGSGQ